MSLINFRNMMKLSSPVGRIYLMQARRGVPSFNPNEIIGCREIVGHGSNSECYYLDHPAFPFPAIRFKETTQEILCFKEKEKGDWRNLTLDEKKALYRASFCQTYAEMLAPTGQWKSHVGIALILLSLGVWWYLIIRKITYYPLPQSFSEESQRAQLRRLIDLEMNPIHGIASKWDYKNNKWK